MEVRKEQCENDEKIRKIKEKITALTDAEDSIHDKVSRFAESGVLDQTESENEITAELERMKEQLDEIQTQKDKLLRQKADYDFKACQVNALLGLIDEMEGKVTPRELGTRPIPTETEKERYGSYWAEVERQLRTYDDPCREIKDFYERTAVQREDCSLEKEHGGCVQGRG